MIDYPIRVLLVMGKLNRAGAETLVMNIFRNIDRSKVMFDFVVHTDEACDYDEEIYSLGGKIYHFPRYNGLNHFQYKKKWNKLFEEHNEYKILHAHNTGSAAVFIPIAKKHGLYTISHSHIATSQSGIRQKAVDAFQFPLRYISDYLFACSEIAGEWLFGKNVSKRKNYTVLRNGIESEQFTFNQSYRNEIRNELNLGNSFVVIDVARFHIQKNHAFLIDIFYELANIISDSKLILVGTGELEGEIKEKVEQLGISNKVVFTGVRSDINKILSAADVFCMPSFREGLPVSLVEAQASGIPVVASDTISKEIAFTNLVSFVPLEENSKKWANNIVEKKDYPRKNMTEEIIASGYDINNTATFLEDFYLKVYEKI